MGHGGAGRELIDHSFWSCLCEAMLHMQRKMCECILCLDVMQMDIVK